MGRSLGLVAYRALSWRRSNPSVPLTSPRPKGEVLWLHATSANRFSALQELGVRLQSQRAELGLLITGEPDLIDRPSAHAALTGPAATNLEVDSFASDHPAEIRQFLNHWQPDLCLWAGAALMPNLINEAANRGIPMFLIDVKLDDLAARKHKWFPDLTRSSLNQFETIMTNDMPTLAMIQRLGASGSKISVTGPLRNGPSPPSFPEDDLSKVTDRLAGRPVWLAAQACCDEFEPILTAHSKALRLAHRLLLVITTASPNDLDALDVTLKGAGLRYARWSVGDDIDDNTQVLISDGVNDLGLWYRVAPLTFMASSLCNGHTGQSPLEAVALGSAVLFGPHVRDHKDTYSHLSTVGAAQTVGDAETLGTAVTRLSAPDQAAAMALAGWQVVTEGAQLTDQLIDLVQDRLDIRGADHARP
ncbi:MAG: 3-deoxy-D-manno-octulosonic acid transferase [Rhodobacteraceae bacterium]|nr:3-deoxy-D-manno-octulosonic acid transferase [Paracoccaceae bacterium]